MKTLKQIKEEQASDAIIQLKDCAVTEIAEEDIDHSGCETCDYGSSYGVEYVFYFSDGTSETFDLEEMYDAPISEGQMMIFLLNNVEEFKSMTKEEFLNVVKDINKVVG